VLRLLEEVWLRCLALGVDVVLDYGFWRRADRDHVRSLVQSVGADAILYCLACSDEEARARIEQRNLSSARSLFIAPATFEALRSRFEPLDADEACVDT
jgi:predicted kinase